MVPHLKRYQRVLAQHHPRALRRLSQLPRQGHFLRNAHRLWALRTRAKQDLGERAQGTRMHPSCAACTLARDPSGVVIRHDDGTVALRGAEHTHAAYAWTAQNVGLVCGAHEMRAVWAPGVPGHVERFVA